MSLKMEAASLNEIKEMVKRHEGYRLEPYRCTENKLTGGYGHVILPGVKKYQQRKKAGMLFSMLTLTKQLKVLHEFVKA